MDTVDKLITDICMPNIDLALIASLLDENRDILKGNWHNIYQKLKIKFKSGKNGYEKAAYAIMYMHNKHFDGLTILNPDEIFKYAQTLEVHGSHPGYLIQLAYESSISIMLSNLGTRLDAMTHEIELLKKENANLQMQIKYMPGNMGYQEAKTEFDKIAQKN